MNVAWVVLHCNRRIGARERRQLIPHVRFQVPFLGPESQLKSGFACAGLLCRTKTPRTRTTHAATGEPELRTGREQFQKANKAKQRKAPAGQGKQSTKNNKARLLLCRSEYPLLLTCFVLLLGSWRIELTTVSCCAWSVNLTSLFLSLALSVSLVWSLCAPLSLLFDKRGLLPWTSMEKYSVKWLTRCNLCPKDTALRVQHQSKEYKGGPHRVSKKSADFRC